MYLCTNFVLILKANIHTYIDVFIDKEDFFDLDKWNGCNNARKSAS